MVQAGTASMTTPTENSPGSSADKLVVSSAEMDEALQERLKKVGLKQREEVVKRAAGAVNIPYIDLSVFPITQESLQLVPEEEARKLQAFCFYSSTDELRMAARDPQSAGAQGLLKRLEEKMHVEGTLYMISEESFRVALERYATLPKITEIKDEVALGAEAIERYRKLIGNKEQLQKTLVTATMTDSVAIIVAAALQLKGSDIHVEAEEKRIVVRLRIDGMLNEVAEIPKDRWHQMVARLKLVSGLKLNIVEKPQDGRFTIVEDGKKIDVRVSTMPTVFGESVVMRILKPMANVQFEDLGIRGRALEQFHAQIEKPLGMIIATGPTGSGKTTTLYSILTKLNTPDKKIITLEDPVEYKLKGINQSQVDASKEYTFSKGLKSILRQDPDIVMVGEIRELETAEIAIQAAMTGHLMISTIHTNSAAGAIPRFLSMGVKGFLLAPSLNAIIGQRLVRKLCEKCKKKVTLDESRVKSVQDIMNTLEPAAGVTFDYKSAVWYGPVGCSECTGGYRGRLGIYEVIIMNKAIEQSILSEKVSEYDIKEIARKDGTVFMVQDGILKAAEGLTSLDEVMKYAAA